MTPAPGPTIARLLTPPGRGGIAVIGLTGPRAGEILARGFRPAPSHTAAGPARLQLGHVVDEAQVLDEVLVHADEAAVEINIHGGSAVAGEVLALLERLGATIAPAPGADGAAWPAAHPRWNNPAIGHEMLAALPHAITPAATAAVTQQWAAGVSELVSGTPTAKEVRLRFRAVPPQAACGFANELREAASGLERMKKVLSPPEVVLAGEPNAGKSSLMNALVGRAVCLVDPTAGTTRDWVCEIASVGGVAFYLTDTAGLWDAPAGIDAEAVRRARARAQHADLVLLLAPGGPGQTPPWLQGQKVLRLASQADLIPPAPDADIAVSAVTGEGLDELRRRILDELGLADFDPAMPSAFTQRQADLLTKLADAIDARDDRAVANLTREFLSGAAAQPRLD
ncbi:MAG: 50S ribosome-binding GTPase [Planctomycetota bacterium]|nr:50S ribosome-binding GTPase [Planctomycetota bacterium]